MTLSARVWSWRYVAEDARRIAAGRMQYLREAMWCLLLVVLGAGRRT